MNKDNKILFAIWFIFLLISIYTIIVNSNFFSLYTPEWYENHFNPGTEIDEIQKDIDRHLDYHKSNRDRNVKVVQLSERSYRINFEKKHSFILDRYEGLKGEQALVLGFFLLLTVFTIIYKLKMVKTAFVVLILGSIIYLIYIYTEYYFVLTGLG